jgi:hypothetical protein
MLDQGGSIQGVMNLKLLAGLVFVLWNWLFEATGFTPKRPEIRTTPSETDSIPEYLKKLLEKWTIQQPHNHQISA